MFKNVITHDDIYSDEDVYSDEEYKSLSDDDISDGIVNFKTLHKSNMIKRAISIRQIHEKRLMDEKKKKEDMAKEKIENAEYKSTVAPLLNWVKNQPTVTNFTEKENTDFPSLNVKNIKEEDDSWISVKAPPNKKDQPQSNFKSNIKSKLCGSIMQNKHCPHGDKCTFAHSRNELNIFDCPFDNCKFVKFYNNSYQNTHKYYKCEKKHKNETDANYFLRTGISDPVTEKEMQDTYDEFICHYNMLTDEMRKTINDLPCDKVIVYHGFSYHGNAMASYKQQQRHQQQQRPFVRKIWTNFVNVIKSQPITQVIHKTVSEDPVKVYIRNKNNKNNDIRLLKVSIDRTEETINRMKKNNNTEFVKKYEKEYKEKMQQLALLEKEFGEIKVEKPMKDVEVEDKVEAVVVEKIQKELKPMVTAQILEIKSNKKIDVNLEELKPAPVIIEQPVEPVVTIDEGWTEVKKIKRNEIPVDNVISCNNIKTQICRSVSQKIKCPYGEKCKYAHKINELNIKDCGFGINCKLVKYINKQYVNTNTMKSCCYRHPSENNVNLYTRNF
jgi:hypothetical protein